MIYVLMRILDCDDGFCYDHKAIYASKHLNKVKEKLSDLEKTKTKYEEAQRLIMQWCREYETAHPPTPYPTHIEKGIWQRENPDKYPLVWDETWKKWEHIVEAEYRVLQKENSIQRYTAQGEEKTRLEKLFDLPANSIDYSENYASYEIIEVETDE